MSPSLEDTETLSREMHANQHTVVAEGRRPGLELARDGRPITLTDWAGELLAECQAVAAVIDSTDFSAAVAQQVSKVENPDTTPSARILESVASGTPFARFALDLSRRHASAFRASTSPERTAEFARLASESVETQAAVEAADEGSFDDYLERYLALDLPELDRPSGDS